MSEVFKKGDSMAVLVPEHIAKALDLRNGDSVDFDLLNNELAAFKKRGIADSEIDVLRKLSDIKFADRTKEKVRSVLSDDEQKVLGALVKRKAISYYDEGKYKGRGVYSISRDYYLLLSEPEKVVKKKVSLADGFRVVGSQAEAEALLSEMGAAIKGGDVIAVRGFDKKFYFVSSDVMNKEGGKITSALAGGEMSLKEIVGKCSLGEGLAKAVIEVLRESGDIIEKRREVYAIA
jgi:antitoxin component of MazEF toxin-antitoxin module